VELNELGLERAVERLGHSVAIAVTARPDRRGDVHLGEPIRVAEAEDIAIRGRCDGSGHRRSGRDATTHLERVDDEVGPQVVGELPADDHPGVHVEDERDVQPALPRRDVGDVGEPQLFGRSATNWRSMRSAGHAALSSGMVVNCFRPRCTPRKPVSAMTRVTVHRATT